jgi:hypothetical protein
MERSDATHPKVAPDVAMYCDSVAMNPLGPAPRLSGGSIAQDEASALRRDGRDLQARSEAIIARRGVTHDGGRPKDRTDGQPDLCARRLLHDECSCRFAAPYRRLLRP